MPTGTASLEHSESLFISRCAELASVAREAILVPYLQVRSALAENRTLFTVLRTKLESGTPPTTSEAMSALVQIVGGVVAVQLVCIPAATLAAAIGTSLGAQLLALGVIAIIAYALIRGLGNVASFIIEFATWLGEKFAEALS